MPSLTWTGEKLRADWMEAFLAGRTASVRPWMKARMPRFPHYAAAIAHGLPAEHGLAPVAATSDVPFDEQLVEAGRRLLGLAHACVDVSDGLLADLGHVCTRSGVGAEVALARLPASAALREVFGEDAVALQATGGDDYELCFTAPPGLREPVALALEQAGIDGARIGRIIAGHGVRAFDADGSPWEPARAGYQHFG